LRLFCQHEILVTIRADGELDHICEQEYNQYEFHLSPWQLTGGPTRAQLIADHDSGAIPPVVGVLVTES
jgi:hypothetical protein